MTNYRKLASLSGRTETHHAVVEVMGRVFDRSVCKFCNDYLVYCQRDATAGLTNILERAYCLAGKR